MYEPHIHDYKTREVEDVKRLFSEYPVIGIVNMEGLPAKTLQKMKKVLRNKMVFKITRKRFIEIAMDEIKGKQNIDQLKQKLEGIPALIFTKEEPFALYKLLEKGKIPAAAKPGQKSPLEITIPAGPTPFTPGPMIGELGQLGIKTEVKEGKINVREDKLLVKEGDVITPKIAELLAKLSIEPMKLGINLLVTYQNGEILGKNVLYIDEDLYKNNIKTAHAQAFALAQHLGIINKDTIKPLVAKTHRAAKFIAEKYNITTPETVGKKLAEAEHIAETIKEKFPELPPQQEQSLQEAVHEKPGPKEESKPAVSPTTEQPSNKQPTPAAAIAVEPKEQSAPQQLPTHESMPSLPPRAEVTIESKESIKPSDMEVAEKFLKDLTEKAIKVGDGKKVEPRVQPQQDVSKLIDQLKDKKSRGEL